MRIVVSGTHASGKSTLISDFAARHRDFVVLPDPFESIDETWDEPGAAMFAAQLGVAARRLLDYGPGDEVIAERGPIDFLAYLGALGSEPSDRVWELAAEAMRRVDLLVVLPLVSPDSIPVSADEHPALRAAMNDELLDLVDDPDLVAEATVIELTGAPPDRLAALERAVAGA